MDKNTYISRVYLYVYMYIYIFYFFCLFWFTITSIHKNTYHTWQSTTKIFWPARDLEPPAYPDNKLQLSNSATHPRTPQQQKPGSRDVSTSWKVLPILCPSDLHTSMLSTVKPCGFKELLCFSGPALDRVHIENRRLAKPSPRISSWNSNMSILESPCKSIKLRLAEFSSHFCCHVEMVGNYCWWKDIYLTWNHCHHAFIVWEPIPSGCLWLVATCLHPECPCSKRSWADIGSEVKMQSMTICLFEEMVSRRLFNADGLPILIGAYGVLLLLGQASHESP